MKAADFADTKASVLGEYIPARAQDGRGGERGYMAVTYQYDGFMLFFFENGKVAKVEMSAYQTKQNRKKLLKRLQRQVAPGGGPVCEGGPGGAADRLLRPDAAVPHGLIAPKTTKNTQASRP